MAALSAGKNELWLIENPEVHLHPAGQAQMGQFLAEVAAAGVQVIVETHSDHVFNGIRRAVKSKRLAADDVASLVRRTISARRRLRDLSGPASLRSLGRQDARTAKPESHDVFRHQS